MVSNKKKVAMRKRNGYEMSSKNVKKEVKEEVDNFQGDGYGSNEINKSLGNLTDKKNKLNYAVRTDVHDSIQLPNKSGSPTKALKYNKNFPVIPKKHKYVPKNKSFKLSGKMNKFSPKQTNLKPIPGIRSSLNTQEKSMSLIVQEDYDDKGKHDIDYEVYENKNVVKGKVTDFKKCIQSKILESGNEKREIDLNSEKEIKKEYPTELPKETERRRERDSRHLFVKGYPVNTTKQDLKALSPDILYISFPLCRSHKAAKKKATYCFMGFKNEKIANKNYDLLQNVKINGQGLVVDFCGSKSKNMKVAEVCPTNTNSKRLTCYGIPLESTALDVAALFPKAILLRLFTGPDVKNADVVFQSSSDAAEAFKSSENVKIWGFPISVMFKKKQKQKKRKFKTSRSGDQQQESSASKRFKQ